MTPQVCTALVFAVTVLILQSRLMLNAVIKTKGNGNTQRCTLHAANSIT